MCAYGHRMTSTWNGTRCNRPKLETTYTSINSWVDDHMNWRITIQMLRLHSREEERTAALWINLILCLAEEPDSTPCESLSQNSMFITFATRENYSWCQNSGRTVACRVDVIGRAPQAPGYPILTCDLCDESPHIWRVLEVTAHLTDSRHLPVLLYVWSLSVWLVTLLHPSSQSSL